MSEEPRRPADVDLATEQAVERTLLAWVRTGLAIMGLGFVVARFGLFLREAVSLSGHLSPPVHRSSLIVGVLLIVLGAAALAVSAVRFVQTLRRLRRGQPAPLALAPGLSVTLSLAIVGLALAVFLLVTAP